VAQFPERRRLAVKRIFNLAKTGARRRLARSQNYEIKIEHGRRRRRRVSAICREAE